MRGSLTVVLCAAALAFACTEGSQTPVSPQSYSAPIYVSPQQSSELHASTLHTERGLDNFRTHLDGDEEVPVRPTDAQGQANFKLSDDGLSIDYKLNVANIENVTQSHIHLAPKGVSGGIVVWLYPSAPPFAPTLIAGRSDGTLAEGVITAGRLINALAGHPLSDLLNAIKAGNAYVNVHTSQFPPGDIRGQID